MVAFGTDRIDRCGNGWHTLSIIEVAIIRCSIFSRCSIFRGGIFINYRFCKITLFNKTAFKVFVKIPVVPLVHRIVAFIDRTKLESVGREVAEHTIENFDGENFDMAFGIYDSAKDLAGKHTNAVDMVNVMWMLN